MSRVQRALLGALLALAAFLPRPALGAFASMGASKDNTLIEDPAGALSNGAGPNFFVGRVDGFNQGLRRRGMIAFDIASRIPAGSTITGVTLTVNMSKSTTGAQPATLYRLLRNWGEGTSSSTGGGGAPSTPGDATWLHTFFNTSFWTTQGGDYAGSPSATIQVSLVGQYTFLSTPGMVADVQAWLDSPSQNFGWIIIGNETVIATAQRFDTRENTIASARPTLTVEYTASATSAGRVPDGGPAPGPPLTVVSAGAGDLRLSWGASCLATDTDYEVYAGAIGAFSGYAPLLCGTGGMTSVVITPAAGNQFYLVVPRNAAREGSYGVDSQGRERAPSAGACVPQTIGACP